MTNPTIRFERIVRDCQSNRDARVLQSDDGLRRHARLIYDFEIIVDGEKRGTFRRSSTSRDYFLRDGLGRSVRRKVSYFTQSIRAKSQAEFDFVARSNIDLLPNAHLIEQIKAKREASKRERYAKEDAENRVAVYKEHATLLFRTMKRGVDGDPKAANEARDLIAMIEAQIADEKVKADAFRAEHDR